jgi:hypothetical protein
MRELMCELTSVLICAQSLTLYSLSLHPSRAQTHCSLYCPPPKTPHLRGHDGLDGVEDVVLVHVAGVGGGVGGWMDGRVDR